MGNQREGYAPGWDADVMAMLSDRTADEHAAFALPFLRSGSRVLDIGCGPGTITLGLAQRVLPDGKCVGVDVQPPQVDAAQRAAAATGATNVSFQIGNAYDLPFTSASFDVAFAHEKKSAKTMARAELQMLRSEARAGNVSKLYVFRIDLHGQASATRSRWSARIRPSRKPAM
jgi:SAM-dependent methyltransferase